jgi:hypothetical protein
MLGPMLGFHALLIGRGISVRFVLPPQRVPDTSDAQMQTLIQTRAIAALTGLGCTIVDVRASTCDARGRQLPAYCEDKDPLHANTAMGEQVLKGCGFIT